MGVLAFMEKGYSIFLLALYPALRGCVCCVCCGLVGRRFMLMIDDIWEVDTVVFRISFSCVYFLGFPFLNVFARRASDWHWRRATVTVVGHGTDPNGW